VGLNQPAISNRGRERRGDVDHRVPPNPWPSPFERIC
jgi:hypothetical protein